MNHKSLFPLKNCLLQSLGVGVIKADVLKSLLLRDQRNAPYITERLSENERFSSDREFVHHGAPVKSSDALIDLLKTPIHNHLRGGDFFLSSDRVKRRRQPGNEQCGCLESEGGNGKKSKL